MTNQPDDMSKFILVGNDYYKVIVNQSANGDEFEELKPVSRQYIIDYHGKPNLLKIKAYDAFTNIPSNGQTIEIRPNLYNLYTNVQHYPRPGQWKWIETLLRHIFGDQYELGLDYIQLLYQYPLQKLPILCLVSRDNATGKTTFLNFLHDLFGANMIIVGNQDIHGRFNTHYASRLIIAVDESKIDKDASFEKLKALATQKTINLEGKFQNTHVIPFFGKFILCSNNEDNFINAKDEDIRFWVRKQDKPKIINVDIEDDLIKEIPAFLYDLQTRQLSTVKSSRMWFTPDQIRTDALDYVRENTKPFVYKELKELIELHFLDNDRLQEFKADPTDFKHRWFINNSRIEISYIRKVIRDEFKMEPRLSRYTPFDEMSNPSKVGRCYTFKRSDFINGTDLEPETDQLPF